jgi:DNA-binding transcriptional LysR family regulator
MELNTLRTFFTLGQTRSFSVCARKLFVTQSAVSHAIKRLEESVNQQLVDRSQKGFALTPAGNILHQSCRTIFFELERAKERLHRAGNKPETIRLGAPVEFGLSIVLKQMKAFFDRHPNIHVDFHLSENLLPPLLDDALDIIIDCRPHNQPELISIPLFREEYSLIATGDYVDKHRIAVVEDLGRCNILSLDKQLTWWRNFLDALPIHQRNIFKKVTEINHIRGIINAALEDIGVGFVPRYTVLKEIEEGSLVELFPGMELLKDQINIYAKRDLAGLENHVALINHIQGFRLQ